MTSKEALEMIRSIDGSISEEQTINECCDIIEEDLEKLCKIRRIYNKSQKAQNNYSADDAICDIGGVLNDK